MKKKSVAPSPVHAALRAHATQPPSQTPTHPDLGQSGHSSTFHQNSAAEKHNKIMEAMYHRSRPTTGGGQHHDPKNGRFI